MREFPDIAWILTGSGLRLICIEMAVWRAEQRGAPIYKNYSIVWGQVECRLSLLKSL